VKNLHGKGTTLLKLDVQGEGITKLSLLMAIGATIFAFSLGALKHGCIKRS
jgi:hypothetical protein